MKALQHAAHIAAVALALHLWHIVASDRMLDAAADVGLDKAATLALHAAKLKE